MPDCEKCPHAAKIELIERMFSEEQNKTSGFKKEVYARLGVLEQANVKTEIQYQNIVNLLQEQKAQTGKQLDKISADIEELKAKPAQRWDKATVTAITGIVSAFVGYAASRIFGGA